MNTHRHNQRKRKRGYKNLFWLVRDTRIGSTQLILYNRKPYKIKLGSKYDYLYSDELRWFSCYDKTFLKNNAINKFNITHNDIVPVKLILDNNNPDLLIRKKKDNLFISSEVTELVKYKSKEKIIELRYPSRISPKLFPEITEESGIFGVRIIKITNNNYTDE